MLHNMGELFGAVARYLGGNENITQVQDITVKYEKRTVEHDRTGYPAFGIVERTTVTVHRLPEQGS